MKQFKSSRNRKLNSTKYLIRGFSLQFPRNWHQSYAPLQGRKFRESLGTRLRTICYHYFESNRRTWVADSGIRKVLRSKYAWRRAQKHGNSLCLTKIKGFFLPDWNISLHIHHFYMDHNNPFLRPKILHNHCVQFLQGMTVVPGNRRQWLWKILGIKKGALWSMWKWWIATFFNYSVRYSCSLY